MGHFVLNGQLKRFVENGRVYDCPGGRDLNLNPETLEPLVEKPVIEIKEVVEEVPVVSAVTETEPMKTDMEKPEEITSVLEVPVEVVEDDSPKKHSCSNMGRGGRYAPFGECPRCDQLATGK